MKHYPLVVVLRCHQWPGLILDTVDAVFNYCRSMPLVVLSVDANPKVREPVIKKFPQVDVFCAQSNWGWGSGLYGLLADTISWLDTKYTYDNLVSIDYDTLFISFGADERLIKKYEGNQHVGLVGGYVGDSQNWAARYHESRHQIAKILTAPKGYKPGESCLGCFMWLTKSGLDGLRTHGFLKDPFRDIRGKIDMADDPWLALLIRTAGLGIESCRDLGYFGWRTAGNYKRFLKEGRLVFHPTKVNRDIPGWKQELDCRNYFRKLRGRPPLSQKDCYSV